MSFSTDAVFIHLQQSKSPYSHGKSKSYGSESYLSQSVRLFLNLFLFVCLLSEIIQSECLTFIFWPLTDFLAWGRRNSSKHHCVYIGFTRRVMNIWRMHLKELWSACGSSCGLTALCGLCLSQRLLLLCVCYSSVFTWTPIKTRTSNAFCGSLIQHQLSACLKSFRLLNRGSA